MGVTTVIKDYGTDILNAIRENDLQRLKQIVEKNLKPDTKIQKLCIADIKHKPTKKFACPLILASRQEDPRIMRWMMEKGIDPNFIHHTIFSSKRKEIVTALHIAVDLGHYDTVQVLLDANADCNIGDHNHETPLHIATKKADKVMVRMLLSKGADPSIPDRKGNAAIHIATLYGHLQLVRSLLKYDADVYQKGQWGTIAPHIAAKEGHIHLIQLFCSRDVGNINIKIPCYPDKREKAPIHLAAENGHVETVLALLDQFEADVNQKDSDGNTPLHCVVLNQFNPHRMRDKEYFNETARVLLKYRVLVNEKNIYGDTALHLAAMNQFQRVVELLLAIGANPFAENDEHLKPIDVVPDFDPVTKQVLKNAMLNPKQPLSASLASFRNELDLTPASSQLYIDRPRKYSENGLIDEHGGRGRQPMRHMKSDMSYVSQSTLSQSMDSVFDDYPSKQPRGRSHSHGRDPRHARHGQRDRQPEPQPSPPQQRRQQHRQQQQQQQMQQLRRKQKLEEQYEDEYDPMYADADEHEPEEPMYSKPEKKPKPKQLSSSSVQTDKQKVTSSATQHRDGDDISLASSRDGTVQSMSTGIPDTSTMNNELKRIIQEQRKQLAAYEEATYSELGSILDSSILESEKPYRPLALKKERPRPSPRSSTRSTSSMRPIPVERSHTPSSMGSRNSPVMLDDPRGQQPGDRNQQQQSHYQNSDAIKVNQIPGKPGTIEVSYGGGPISISVDPHSGEYHIQRQDQGGQHDPDEEHSSRQEEYDHNRNDRHRQYQQQQHPPYNKPPNYDQRHYHQSPPDQMQYNAGQTRSDQHGHSPKYNQASSSYTHDYNEDYNGFYDSTEIESQHSASVYSTDREVVRDAIKDKVFEVMGHRTLESAQDSYNESPVQQEQQPRTKPVAQKRSKTPTSEQKNEGLSLPPESQKLQQQRDPPQAIHVTRAVSSVSHEEDIEPSPDVTPNTSPQYKSFSQKMALFKEQDAKSREATPEAPRTRGQANREQDHQARESTAQVRRNLVKVRDHEVEQDLSQMVDTPEAKNWNIQSGGSAIVEHTDIQELEGSPASRRVKRMDYSNQPIDRDSSYMASAQITSSYGEESESDEESISQTPALIKASQHPYESHDKYYSIAGDVDVNSEPSSATQTPNQTPRTTVVTSQSTHTVRTTQVTQRTTQQELPTQAEPYKVSSKPPIPESSIPKAELHEAQTEEGSTEQLYEYEEEPGSRRLNLRRNKTVSPVAIEITPPKDELRSSGAKTPDSLFSDDSRFSTGSLNMRVTGEVPKAYSKRGKTSARKAFMLAKPEGIESCSENSDIESGSLTRMSRRGLSESDRWSKYSEPETPKKESSDTNKATENTTEEQEQASTTKDPALKLMGPLPKPYKTFGKIEPKIDALLDALEENASEAAHRAELEASMLASDQEHRIGHWVEQSEPTQVSMENLTEEGIIAGSQSSKQQANTGLEQGLNTESSSQSYQIQSSTEIHFIDSDEGSARVHGIPNVRAQQADTSLSDKSFKRNLKMSEPTAESYNTHIAEQQVGDTRTEVVKSAEISKVEIVEIDEINTSKSSTDFDEDREAQSYGEGPRVADGMPDIRRPPKPKLYGEEYQKNRHSIESEVETIPIDPEFIIEEPKKKKPPRPKVVHPIPETKTSKEQPCPVAQQVSSNFGQQVKNSSSGRTGRITPKATLAVLDTLEEQSESDMSEAYEQEPTRRVPKEKGVANEKQITHPESATVASKVHEYKRTNVQVHEVKDSIADVDISEFEDFGKGVKSRSSGIEMEVQKSPKESDAGANAYLENYDQEPGAKKWGRSRVQEGRTERPSDDTTSGPTVTEDNSVSAKGRFTDRPTERPPSPPKQSRDDVEITSYDEEPGARRHRPQNYQTAGQQKRQEVDDTKANVEGTKDRSLSSEDEEVALISAAADERKKEKQAKKQSAALAGNLKQKPEAAQETVIPNYQTTEDKERARQAAIHREMVEKERQERKAEEQALLHMQSDIRGPPHQSSEGQSSIPAANYQVTEEQAPPPERIKGRRQMGGPQGRPHMPQQQQQGQQRNEQHGFPSNQQFEPQHGTHAGQTGYPHPEMGENEPTGQKIPTRLLAEPEKKKKGGFFSFGSSRKKRPERSSESSGGGKSDSEYKSDGETKKKKKGLFGRRKDPDSDSINAPQVTIQPNQQIHAQGGPQNQPYPGERPIDVGGQETHSQYSSQASTHSNTTTPDTSPGTPYTPQGILGTVMGAPSGSNIERSDTVRESKRKAGFFSRKRDKQGDNNEYGATPYAEGELGSDEHGPPAIQGHQQLQHYPGQTEQQQEVRGPTDNKQSRWHRGETNLDDVIVQGQQQERNVRRHPSQEHDDRMKSGQAQSNSADLAAQLWAQQQGPPQQYQDQQQQYRQQQQQQQQQQPQRAHRQGDIPYQTDQVANQLSHGQRDYQYAHQGDRNYPVADDAETVSKMWKQRDERENEMQRILMSMSDQEMTAQSEDAFYAQDQAEDYQFQGPAKWGKSKSGTQEEAQSQISGQPAMGSFQDAAFSSLTSSIEEQKRKQSEEEKIGQYKQSGRPQQMPQGSKSPIRRPQPVYGSPPDQRRNESQKTMAEDEATVASMWGAQHKPDPRWLHQQGVNIANRAQTEVVVMGAGHTAQQQQQQQQQSQEPFQRGRWGASRRSKKRPANVGKSSGALSDSEAFSKRKSAKSISFDDNLNDEDGNIHSEAEMFDMEGPRNKAEASRTLQQVAMDTISAELNYQPKLKPRRPVWEQTEERPVTNYTRGAYNRNQGAKHESGRSVNQAQTSSSRYDDSALVGRLWSDSQRQVFTDSEAEADTEDMTMDQSMDAGSSRGNSMTRGVSGIPHTTHHKLSKHSTPEDQTNKNKAFSAFSPVSSGNKKVKIVEGKKKKKRKDKPPQITEPGPVDFSQYDMTARLWMERVDKKTVQKSKTMKLFVLPEGQAPPDRIASKVRYEMTSDDVFLPPQWVIARGRSLRKKKHLSSSSSLGARRTPTSMLNDSDYELSDRPFSPGRQLVLFFKVGSNWKDLAWVLFEGILTDSETIRMIKDIQLKNPGQLTDQVHDLMKRWWARRGPSATIEELQIAMDIINMGYIKEEHLNDRNTSVTSYTDTEDDLDISEIDEADPDVSRLINEYQTRSHNASFECEIPPENRGSQYRTDSTSNMLTVPGSSNISADNLLQRLDQRGLLPPSHSGSSGSRGTLDASRDSLSTGRKSPGYGSGRRSPYNTGGRSPGVNNNSFRYDPSQEDYSLDEEGRQRFLIIQPQLRQNDYRHETAI